MKHLLTTVIIAFSTITLSGQTIENKTLKHNIGFDAGFSSGYGISYRYMPKTWGIQINTFPIASAEEYNISAGVTLFRTIFKNNLIHVFGYYGNHFNFKKEESLYYYGYEASSVPSKGTPYTTQNSWITGIGPGVEFTIAQRLSLNIRMGLAYYTQSNSEDWLFSGDGGIGLHFKF